MSYLLSYSMFKEHAPPQEMDNLWAKGWRHFGQYFFCYNLAIHENKQVKVIPLRIKISDYVPSKRHRKITKKCQMAGMHVDYQPITINETKHQIFEFQKKRFKDNKPCIIYDFLHPDNPAQNPCPAMECCVYNAQNQLIAVSFFDVGSTALSSVYAMFLPEYEKFSLGIYTILCEITFAQQHQKSYLYLGYCYDVPSFYDYKKQFAGLEYYDWNDNWLPFTKQ
ncbi:MAG: arginine-tRNA-protein transferase [Microscillaceae bacterium]|nr:arginine-tRNA-protein transferase [Microscillaceae bacterium]MDW8460226.1 arginine-tRNA-protein transferase [Cytophagales bacterium]